MAFWPISRFILKTVQDTAMEYEQELIYNLSNDAISGAVLVTY